VAIIAEIPERRPSSPVKLRRRAKAADNRLAGLSAAARPAAIDWSFATFEIDRIGHCIVRLGISPNWPDVDGVSRLVGDVIAAATCNGKLAGAN